nr:IS66 family insertion sequence element accessory protein TnpB [Zhaonella formicivorans]
MINEITNQEVYLACGSTDLRKSIDSLAVLVKEALTWIPSAPAYLSFATATGTN